MLSEQAYRVYRKQILNGTSIRPEVEIPDRRAVVEVEESKRYREF